MFRATACAAFALVTLSTVTAGAAPSCATDPKGDVVVARTSTRVDAPHLDLVRLSVTRGTRDVVATFHTAGGPGNGTWSMFFQYGSTYEFHVRTQRNEGLPWAAAPDPRFPQPATLVQIVRWRPDPDGDGRTGESRQVRGARTDFGTPGQVRVVIPLAELGAATPKRGATARVGWARARQMPAAVAEIEDYADCR